MISWKTLDSEADLKTLIEKSHQTPSAIFKHSPMCPVSSMVLRRLESNWDFDEEELDVYYLDLLTNRALSDEVSRQFDVRHESPQILLIKGGEVIYDASHGRVSVGALKKVLNGRND